jgi:hypothetical protein
MSRLRVVVLLVLVAVGLAPAAPASAGGWAVTLLDPLPDRIEPDRAYTVGYWVLQHGSHPFDGELGRTGLRLVGQGRELEFEGRALPEAAHYAVSFAVPAGTWRVYARQGWFDQFELGTLTVPGGLKLAPPETVYAGGPKHGHGTPQWGAVHPPGGVGKPGEVRSVPARPVATPAAAPPAEPAPQPRTAVAVGVLAGCGVLALAAAGLARPLRRRLRG